MSNVIYPIELIQEQDTKRQDRTIVDAFENGATTARSYWAAQNFKRLFQLTHSPLTVAEFKYLRSFYSQRSGQYDPFWYRDNINRGGNALVRFASTLDDERASGVVTLQNTKVNLAEVAPVRALPEFDEIAGICGAAPLLWYDANREIYRSHMGVVTLDAVKATWDVMEQYRAPWQAGLQVNLGNVLSQYQHYNFTGVEWAKTAATITGFSTTQPAYTIFCIARHSATTTAQMLFGTGSGSEGLGIGLNAGGEYYFWYGDSEPTTVLIDGNSPADTWRSLAVHGSLGDTDAVRSVNGVDVITSPVTQNFAPGPFALGADLAGTKIANPANAMTNANVAQVLIFPANVDVRALHNLFAAQYGLPLAP